MVNSDYIPARGDIIWLDFNPQKGKEQAGKRPALVLSPYSHNAASGLVIVCPITSRIKNYPFEVPLDSKSEVSGAVLVNQIRSIDWKMRKTEYGGKSSAKVLEEVFGRLDVLL